MIRSLEHVCASSGDGVVFGCTDDDRLRTYGGKAVDVRPQVKLHNVTFSQSLGSEGIRAGKTVSTKPVVCKFLGCADIQEGGKVGDGVVHGNTCWECDT